MCVPDGLDAECCVFDQWVWCEHSGWDCVRRELQHGRRVLWDDQWRAVVCARGVDEQCRVWGVFAVWMCEWVQWGASRSCGEWMWRRDAAWDDVQWVLWEWVLRDDHGGHEVRSRDVGWERVQWVQRVPMQLRILSGA